MVGDNYTQEEKYENELKYKRIMNYSILRYKTLNKDFYSDIDIKLKLAKEKINELIL